MTIQRMIELLEIEHECMLRGAHDACDRNCADCELVQDDGELHEMYASVIALLKEQEEREKRICKEICDFIRDGCSTDTEADKEFVCNRIQEIFIKF